MQIKTLTQAAVLSLSLLITPLQAENANFDVNTFELNLPSVALVSDGEIQGYFSIDLQVLSNQEGQFTLLDNAYVTGLIRPVTAVPMIDEPSASYDAQSEQLSIPAVIAGNADPVAVTLRILAALDGAFVLGL